MTPIASAEKRQVRPCKGNEKNGSDKCVFYLGGGIGYNGEWAYLCELDRFATELGYTKRKKKPCDSHFTKEEMQEFIDQHNAGESIKLTPEISERIQEIINKHKQQSRQEG